MARVAIDCFHEHLPPVDAGTAVVAIDVIRATTTAISGAVTGHHVYPAGSIEAAVRLAADLDRPLLAGELGGVQPYGFDLQNSPSEIVALAVSERPIILLSTSGTRLVTEAAALTSTYLACLRNVSAQARHLLASGRDALILGADSRGEFREEDQLCAARIAAALVAAGYEIADSGTEATLSRWADAPDDAFTAGRSARYLRETDQEHDLAFVLEHVDDLDQAFSLEAGRVQAVPDA